MKERNKENITIYTTITYNNMRIKITKGYFNVKI